MGKLIHHFHNAYKLIKKKTRYDNGILAICLIMSDFQHMFSFDSVKLTAAILSVPLGASCISAIVNVPLLVNATYIHLFQ
jgi:hypothetical protein